MTRRQGSQRRSKPRKSSLKPPDCGLKRRGLNNNRIMPKKKLYTLLPEHKARFPEWRDRWIANALSTKPMDDEERRIVRDAVKGLYRAANLDPPPDNRIVFVPSPFVGAFAAGFAAWIWWMREHKRSAATLDVLQKKAHLNHVKQQPLAALHS